MKLLLINLASFLIATSAYSTVLTCSGKYEFEVVQDLDHTVGGSMGIPVGDVKKGLAEFEVVFTDKSFEISGDLKAGLLKGETTQKREDGGSITYTINTERVSISYSPSWEGSEGSFIDYFGPTSVSYTNRDKNIFFGFTEPGYDYNENVYTSSVGEGFFGRQTYIDIDRMYGWFTFAKRSVVPRESKYADFRSNNYTSWTEVKGKCVKKKAMF